MATLPMRHDIVTIKHHDSVAMPAVSQPRRYDAKVSLRLLRREGAPSPQRGLETESGASSQSGRCACSKTRACSG